MHSPIVGTPVSGRVAVTEGVGLRVLEWEGLLRPFLLVHGLASNALLWSGVAEHLVAAGHRVVSVDLRGHGESDAPACGYSTAVAAADLATVSAEFGSERPVVVGQSWGGNVVLRHAEFSAEVHAVACVDGGWLHLGDRFASWEQCWASLAPPPFAGVTAASMVSMLRRRHPDWSDGAIQATMANLRVGPDGTVEPRLAREHHARILRSLWEDRPRDRYERIGVPVLLAPAGDPAGPTGPLVDEAARLLPRATVRWYAGADHDVHAQYPAEVAADLLALA
ncbi:MAG: alpha/beta fold hydrolase [Geodermatophilaceae bacterium]|nr:alpha/beta fold hydrolase [Geodermatophilaceae bacterium]